MKELVHRAVGSITIFLISTMIIGCPESEQMFTVISTENVEEWLKVTTRTAPLENNPQKWEERYGNEENWATTRPPIELLQPAIRFIYFLPNDREVRTERAVEICRLITEVQAFYADGMERNGFGKKAFTVETYADGTPVIHFFKGKHGEEHYWNRSNGDLLGEFFEDKQPDHHIYVIVVDTSYEAVSGGACGIGAPVFIPVRENAPLVLGRSALRLRDETQGDTVTGGIAMIPASGYCFLHTDDPYIHKRVTAIHEIGHTLGLMHDPRGYHAAIGGWGNELSHCDAEWLSVSRYFNSNPLPEDTPGIIRMTANPEKNRKRNKVPLPRDGHRRTPSGAADRPRVL